MIDNDVALVHPKVYGELMVEMFPAPTIMPTLHPTHFGAYFVAREGDRYYIGHLFIDGEKKWEDYETSCPIRAHNVARELANIDNGI